MAEVSETLTIARSSDEVWAVLRRFDCISAWAPNVDHACLLTAQLDGVGASRRVQVGRTALLERVTTWDEGTRLAYEIEGLPPVVRSVTTTWQLDPSGDAATDVTVTSRIDAGSRPPQRLVARAVGRALGGAARDMLGGLRDHLEEDRP